HFCLGAPLARMEVTLALESLFGRFPDLRLADPERAPCGERPLSTFRRRDARSPGTRCQRDTGPV
ncbi:cytochrome P450, partial [Streptomyces violaceoruber]